MHVDHRPPIGLDHQAIDHLADDAMMPAQWIAMHRRDARDPLQRLWLAVLLRAIQDMQNEGKQLRCAQAARGWIASPGFGIVCDWLELDVDVTRKRLLEPGFSRIMSNRRLLGYQCGPERRCKAA